MEKRIEVGWNKYERLWELTFFDENDYEIDECWQVPKCDLKRAIEKAKRDYGIEKVVKVKAY